MICAAYLPGGVGDRESRKGPAKDHGTPLVHSLESLPDVDGVVSQGLSMEVL